MKNLIGISEQQKKYVLDELARMAKSPELETRMLSGDGQQARRIQKDIKAGAFESKSSKRAAAAAATMFRQRTVRQRAGISSFTAASPVVQLVRQLQ